MENNNKKYAIKLESITKWFLNGKVKANTDINLNVEYNEVHALIGENGAGKSTLMSILFGIYEQDSGDIYINGEKVKFKSAKDAQKYKIGMVHQHFKLVDNYTVLDNIILGSEPTYEMSRNSFDLVRSIGIVNKNKAKKRLLELIKKYDFNLNIYDRVEQLTVGQQQKVEILKLLYRDSDILIFDEPTAVLSDNEIASFLQMIKDFKENGKTIIIISHKLNEIKEVADNCTVIRHGKVVGNFSVKSTSIKQMSEAMVGRTLNPVLNNSEKPFDNNQVILEVKNLPLSLMRNPNVKFSKNKFLSELFRIIKISEKINNVKKMNYDFWKMLKMHRVLNLQKPQELDFTLPSISFQIKAGEIFAIAGVEGNGQSELVEIISGLRKSPENTVIYNTDVKHIFNTVESLKELYSNEYLEKTYNNFSNDFIKNEWETQPSDASFKSINWRYNNGLSFIPEDRHKHGLFLDDSIGNNTVINDINSKKFNKFGLINKTAINNHALKIINEFDVRGVGSLDDPVRGLSGGNQQKLIIGRELNKSSDLIIFIQPTRGLDVGAIEYIHSRILKAKEENKAVLLVSYELDEILALADTIAVMSKSQIVGVGPKKEMTRNKIGFLMAHGNEQEYNTQMIEVEGGN